MILYSLKKRQHLTASPNIHTIRKTLIYYSIDKMIKMCNITDFFMKVI